MTHIVLILNTLKQVGQNPKKLRFHPLKLTLMWGSIPEKRKRCGIKRTENGLYYLKEDLTFVF
jgi:hypothetical protein